MSQIKKLIPPLYSCFNCNHEYRGTHCPICKVEHPAFTAIKNIAKKTDEEFLANAVQLAGEVC